MKSCLLIVLVFCAGFLMVAGCEDPDANDQLIGGECLTEADCDDGNDDTPPLECILAFKGGYCGRANCTTSEECPPGSMCAEWEQVNYCFLTCGDSKVVCNQNRQLENEANCAANVDPIENPEQKVCVPPSGI